MMISSRYYMPQRSVEDLKQLAKDTGLTSAEHVRRAVTQYLDRQTKQAEKPARVQLEG